VALLAEGGHLVQYDTPSQLLGHPVDAFATEFVGRDRGLRRLEVTVVAPSHLVHVPSSPVGASASELAAQVNGVKPDIGAMLDEEEHLVGFVQRPSAGEPPIVQDPPEAVVVGETTLRDAMAALLLADHGWVPVSDDDGHFLGVLTPEAIHRATREAVNRSAPTSP
jgi:osmoprotectant transport system ATP-binding protein